MGLISHHSTKSTPPHSCADAMSHRYDPAQLLDITAGHSPLDLKRKFGEFFVNDDSKCPVKYCSINAADQGAILASVFKGFTLRKTKQIGSSSDFEQNYYKLEHVKESGS